jgi:hypothetical protein
MALAPGAGAVDHDAADVLSTKATALAGDSDLSTALPEDTSAYLGSWMVLAFALFDRFSSSSLMQWDRRQAFGINCHWRE